MRRDSRVIKVYNDKRRDVISAQQVRRLEGAEQLLADLLADGYVLYDVKLPANTGFQALSSVGVGKYVCVWKTAAPDAATELVMTAAWFTRHTDVQVIGAKLDANNRISSHGLELFLDNGGHDYQSKLTFSYGLIKVPNADTKITKANFTYCSLTNYASTPSYLWLVNCSINNCDISAYSAAGGKYFIIETTLATVTNKNNYYSPSDADSPNFQFTGSLVTAIYENNIFSGFAATYAYQFAYNADFLNCYFETATVQFDGTSSNGSIVYFQNSSISSIAGAANYRLVPASKNQQWYSVFNYVLAYAKAIVTANYLTMAAQYTPGRRTTRGMGVITKNILAVAYDNHYVDDALKQIDDDDMLVEWREDIESTFTTLLIAKIKNYLFYKTDGTTEVTTFADNDSFLVIATRDAAATEYAVFAWYKGELSPTVFSEVYLNELYTVVRLINLWEMPEQTDIRQSFPIDDSPLEGTLQLADMTSRVVR